MNNTLKSFHNDKAIKDKYIKRVKDHCLADELIKGTGWTGTKGCAVGCTLNQYKHSAYETELGIPIEIARLEDAIFEGLPNKQAMEWPERFLESIPIGVDLSMVWPKFIVWTLEGVIQYARPDGKIAINKVIDLFKQWVAGNKPSNDEFIAARKYVTLTDAADAADAAADAAAYAAADAAYAVAAYAVAADAADAATARNKFWIQASDKLIDLLKEEIPND